MLMNDQAVVVLDNAFSRALPSGPKEELKCNKALSNDALYELYRANPLLGIVAEFYPERMIKDEFVDIELDDDTEYGASFVSWAEDNNLIEALFHSLVYSNVYGTHLCIIDVDDGKDISRLSKPINYSAIKSIKQLTPIRFELANVRVRDSLEDYEKGINGVYYRIGNIEWHEDRIIRFDSTAVNEDPTECSQSKIEAVLEAFNFYEDIHAVVSKISNSASIPILGIEGLIMKLGGDEDSRRIITERLKLAAESIKRMGAIGIDLTSEKIDFVERNLQGLDTIVQIAKDKFASVAQIPDSMLFQRKSSGGGLSDSGLMERSTAASITSNLQTRMLKSPIRRLVRIFAAIEGITGDLKITFPSTLELSKEETAKIRKLDAESDNLDAQTEKILVETELLETVDDAPERLADASLPGGNLFVETNPSDQPTDQVNEQEDDPPVEDDAEVSDSLGKSHPPAKQSWGRTGIVNLSPDLIASVLDETRQFSGTQLSEEIINETIENIDVTSLRRARTAARRYLRKQGLELPVDESEIDGEAFVEASESYIQSRIKTFNSKITKFLSGVYVLSRFQSEVIEEIIQGTLVESNFGLGDDLMEDEEAIEAYLDIVREELTSHFGNLSKVFDRMVGSGISEVGVRSRILRYISYSTTFFHEAYRATSYLAGKTEEQRFTYPTGDSCNPCLDYEAQGVVPIYTLPAPGQECDCRDRCRCTMLYY